MSVICFHLKWSGYFMYKDKASNQVATINVSSKSLICWNFTFLYVETLHIFRFNFQFLSCDNTARMARLGLGTKNNLLVLEKAALVAKIKAGDVRKIAFLLPDTWLEIVLTPEKNIKYLGWSVSGIKHIGRHPRFPVGSHVSEGEGSETR